jgi:2'-phosphotransferase
MTIYDFLVEAAWAVCHRSEEHEAVSHPCLSHPFAVASVAVAPQDKRFPMSGSLKQKDKTSRPSPGRGGGKQLRGLPKDSPDVRVSKTLSWILRHGAKSESLYMRPDGYVRVSDLVCLHILFFFEKTTVERTRERRDHVKRKKLASPRLSSSHTPLDLAALQRIVENDAKKRYMLLEGPDETAPMAGDVWWIRANQGHSLKVLVL